MKDRVYHIYEKMHNGNEIVGRLLHYYLRVVFACDIMPKTKIGNGTRFPHNGLGVVINDDVIIGENCNIGKGVVIGGRGEVDVPVIGNNVLIGANAIIIGGINIGNNVKIGAGAVVLADIPSNATAVGNPAKVVRIDNCISD